MKKGLLLAIGVSAGLGLAAQAPKVAGVKKANLKGITVADAGNIDFFANASLNQRNGSDNSPLAVGTRFTSSRNAFGVIVSQSNCLTANQALGAVMWTNRLSADWSPDANVSSGYISHHWTTNNGGSWDSTYFADYTNLGNMRFRYPSGAIINPAGNTTLGNAWLVATGPYTDGSGWAGYYSNAMQMSNSATSTAVTYTNGNTGNFDLGMPRVDMTGYGDSSAWVSAGIYTDYLNLDGFTGAALMKGKFNGTTVNWTFDSILPAFHQDGNGVNDTWTQAHLAFSANGQIGYCVFFGVDAAATTSQTRTFLPLVWKTTDHGATWNRQPLYDFTQIPVINDNILSPATDGNNKPWFSQTNGSDVVVDANGQLHIICTIEAGASNDNDSLGFTWNLNSSLVGQLAQHKIYDVHTTANGWDAWLIDSLMCTPDPGAGFTDGTSNFDTDARLQASITADGQKIFYVWVDSDVNTTSGANILPNLKARGVNLTTGLFTPTTSFTTSEDVYWHYVSTTTLVSGNTYTIPVTNSIGRVTSTDMIATFDHYYINNVQFTDADFTLAIGINENTTVGSFGVYPNPANEIVNVNLNLDKSESIVINIFNSLGQIVVSDRVNAVAGANNIQLNTANLEAGVYFVNITSGNSTSTQKLIIE